MLEHVAFVNPLHTCSNIIILSSYNASVSITMPILHCLHLRATPTPTSTSASTVVHSKVRKEQSQL